MNARVSIEAVKQYIPEDERATATVKYSESNDYGYSVRRSQGKLSVTISNLAGPLLGQLRQAIQDNSVRNDFSMSHETPKNVSLLSISAEDITSLGAQNVSFMERGQLVGFSVTLDQVRVSPELSVADFNALAATLRDPTVVTETSLRPRSDKANDKFKYFIAFLVASALLSVVAGLLARYGII